MSPSMANVLPIQGVDIPISKEMAITFTTRLTEGRDPFSLAHVKWVAMDVLSIMVEANLVSLRELYKIFMISNSYSQDPKNEPTSQMGGVVLYTLTHSWVG
ncbi:hypothetical protein Adt_42125 [Abeliophyllum distichum]|uniref:Uncharacterized protein n=1 Tax=Abeliophyllum distichum TaxID=126358 RepID=A0ABD1PRL9_9LAMI